MLTEDAVAATINFYARWGQHRCVVVPTADKTVQPWNNYVFLAVARTSDVEGAYCPIELSPVFGS